MGKWTADWGGKGGAGEEKGAGEETGGRAGGWFGEPEVSDEVGEAEA